MERGDSYVAVTSGAYVTRAFPRLLSRSTFVPTITPIRIADIQRPCVNSCTNSRIALKITLGHLHLQQM